MRRSFVLFAALLPFLAAGLAACGGDDEATPAGAELSVEDFAFAQLEDGTRVFSGKIYNSGSEPVRQARLSVSLLDANNRQIGTTTVGVSNIAPQDTTSFRQVLDSSQDVGGVRVSSLTVM